MISFGSSPKSRQQKISLGTLEDIIHNYRTCPLCSLVAHSLPLEDGQEPDTLEPKAAQCYANWEIDGRVVDRVRGTTKPRTRRIHISWDDESLRDSYLVFVAPERYQRFSSDAKGVWQGSALFLGRELEGNNHVQMKSWIDSCRLHHGPNCHSTRNEEFENMVRQSYFGVIDVLDMRLTSLPIDERDTADERTSPSPSQSTSGDRVVDRDSQAIWDPYVALSYVRFPYSLRCI